MLPSNYKALVIGFFFLAISCPTIGQTNTNEDIKAENLIEEQNAVREEIQRYFGYEDLLYRYITIPYDTSAHVNQQGKFVDIGFAFFALLPVLLLYFFYDKKRWFYGLMIFLTLYLAICFRFSFLLDISNQQYNPMVEGRSVSPQMEGFDGNLLRPVYSVLGNLGNPIKSVLDNVTGQKDHISYPFICLLYLTFTLLLFKSIRISERMKLLLIILSSFAFLWWILSSGIIWYGFLMIPLFYVLIIYCLHWRTGMKNIHAFQVSQSLTFIVLISWIFLSYTSRISNVTPNIMTDHPDYAKYIVEPRIQPYSTGYLNERESLNRLANNILIGLDRLNADSSLILQFGTSLAFDIKGNNKRIIEDNSLGYFYDLVVEHRTQTKVTEVIKARGIKYLILDFQLRTLDRTPEKTLTRKYNILTMLFLKDNPGIRLVATDQIVKENGTNVMGVFSDNPPVVIGTYGVFEIL